ncbi:MAG TPA: LysM peptidoglycan-binding domain-containing protein [Anaerolineales bacterium]|nr:LysM peptidoglycan-binding domain-containing protein [Anaerolineales bacterium]
MSNFRKLITMFLAFIILIGVAGFNVPSALAASCTKYHTVKKGEYLVQIGRIYGVHWRTLADWNNLRNPSLIYPGQKLCVEMDGKTPPPPPPPPSKIPTFSIVSVVEDDNVTIRTANFPANDSFDVLMGAYGTAGIRGKLVDTIKSGEGGSITANFRIPASLRGLARIAIRLQSPKSGYFSYNWFWNNSTGGGGTTPPPAPGKIPTFSIASVVRDSTVTVKTADFPANRTFVVRMGAFGTRAIGGIEVARFDSGAGGSLSKTFEIPSALRGSTRIAIRTEATGGGYFSYNWFWNNTYP